MADGQEFRRGDEVHIAERPQWRGVVEHVEPEVVLVQTAYQPELVTVAKWRLVNESR